MHFASNIWLNSSAKMISHPLNEALSDAFEGVFLDKDKPSRLVNASVNADKQRKMFYYAKPEEITARAFEACIQHHAIKNHFLAAGTKQSEEAKQGLYPNNLECDVIWKCHASYFSHLAASLSNS